MTYFTAADLRQQAGGVTGSAAQSELSRVAKSTAAGFDIFLSHSVRDAVLILGLKRMLESEDLSVYVDWIEDADLDRMNVTAATAARLRERMKSCRALVYATSQNASASRWMPWKPRVLRRNSQSGEGGDVPHRDWQGNVRRRGVPRLVQDS